MSLIAGSRLGSYDIASLLGSGGMGEVYRARDTRLGRDVALKVLREAFTLDAERLARFQREAQLLASLSHPNIAAIYGLEEADGVRALILELVEGPTLADRIVQGPIPFDEALPIARQIADALEAAHEQGIIHRDLKPSNIKVKPDGTVKVLDFGLAKTVETGAPSASGVTGLTQSPTLTSPALTRLGLILGTAAYMAPEQAKGHPADRRSDIWAFGCVLYEMLTSRRAFGGDDVADTLAAVLRADPEWSALPGEALPVRALLERCLRKDARKRLPHIGAARLDLDEAIGGIGKLEPLAATNETRRRGRLAWTVAGAATLLAVVLAIPAVMHWREAPATVPLEMRLEIATPATPDPSSFALSPDARQLVFVATVDGARQLWLRSLDAVSARPLAGTDGARAPFWSSDGRSVGFFTGSALRRIDLAGGSPRTLAPAVPGLGGAENADGVILFASGTIGFLQRVSASGGDLTAVTSLADGDLAHVQPSFLPDNRHFLVFVRGKQSGLYLGSLDSPKLDWLTEAESGGAFVAPDWVLYVRDGALVARRFDFVKRVLLGDPVIVADPVSVTASLSVPFSASATGVLSYRGAGSVRRQLVWSSRSGTKIGEGTPILDGNLANPEISPDGQRIVVERLRENNSDIWVIDGPRMVRITTDGARDGFPSWSHDGTRIFFASQRTGRMAIYETRSDSSGGGSALVDSLEGAVPTQASRDGRFLFFMRADRKTREYIGALPLDGERTPRVVADTPFTELWGQLSPDGKWIAYQSNESGPSEVYVQPFPGPGGRWQISTAGGISARWAPTGREVYYIAPDGKLMTVPFVVSGTTPKLGTPVALFNPGLINGGSQMFGLRQQYDVSKDGRFLLNVTAEGEVLPPITILLNWARLSEQR